MSKDRATIGTDGLPLPILPPERDARVWARLVRVMFYLPGFMGLLLIKTGEPASFGITVELLMLSSASAIVGGLFIGSESTGAGANASSKTGTWSGCLVLELLSVVPFLGAIPALFHELAHSNLLHAISASHVDVALGASELSRGQRAVRGEPGKDLLARGLGHLVPALALGTVRAPPECVVRPLGQGQDAGRMGPVLESGRLAGIPVGPFDPLPRNGPQAGICHQFMRPGQDADGIQLDAAQPVKHPDHPAAAPASAQKPLRTQGHPPHLVRGQHFQTHAPSVAGGSDISGE